MSRRVVPAVVGLIAGAAGPLRRGQAHPKGAPVRQARRERDVDVKLARKTTMVDRAEAKRKRKAAKRRGAA